MENNNLEKRNLIFAVVFSAVLLFLFDAMFPSDARNAKVAPQPVVPATANTAPATAPAPAKDAAAVATAPVSVESAAEENRRVAINAPSVHGSLRLKGARFDNLMLTKYRETLDENSPHISLLSPVGTAYPFFAEFGWVSTDGLALPNAETPWQTENAELSENSPLTLTWDNGAGLRFIRQISVDANYMFTVSDRIENYGAKAVTLFN